MSDSKKKPIDYARPPRSKLSGHKSRHLAQMSNIPLLGRSKWLARVQQVASQGPAGRRYPQMMAFLEVSKWLIPYLRDVLHRKAPYQTYPRCEMGIFPMDTEAKVPLRLAVVADWGTGTMESATVAENIEQGKPHYTLHLGDVYHMGDAQEVAENCLGLKTKSYGGVVWPRGSRGSFALMGNHEMYSGGQGFYETFLPKLGLRDGDGKLTQRQTAGFFCLQAEHWVVLGLDTGYHSGGIPLLASIPGVRDVEALNVDAHFDVEMMEWLRETVEILRSRPGPRKTVIVMTHHQPTSSFEPYFRKPSAQLAELGFLEGEEFVWLYGHEHRLTVYKKQTVANGLVTYPRCIGHGGMPVSVSKLKRPDDKVLYWDPRTHAIDVEHPKTKVGYNGHLMLTMQGKTLKIDYHDIVDNRVLLTEAFTADGKGGVKHDCGEPAADGLLSGS